MDPRLKDLLSFGPPPGVHYPLPLDRTPERVAQAHGLLEVECLEGFDSPLKIAMLSRALCDQPEGLPPVAALCVYPAFVLAGQGALGGRGVRLSTVAGGFPHGLTTLEAATIEVATCAAMEVDEIEVVIPRYMARSKDWMALSGWISELREAAHTCTFKVTISAGELANRLTIYRATMCALVNGAEFVKTCTGKESDLVSPEVVEPMLHALADWHNETNVPRGLVIGGGVESFADAAPYLSLVQQVLGEGYLKPSLLRFSSVGLVDDLRGS